MVSARYKELTDMSALRPTIDISGKAITIDLPHLAFASLLGGWSAWFCRDAWLSGPNVENLILIAPASVLAVLLYLFVAAGCFRVHAKAEGAVPAPALAGGNGIKIAGSMVLLAAFVGAGPLIGFDVASFGYIFAMLVFLGERRIWVLVLAPLIFCLAVIYGFNRVLETPLPLFFFNGDGS
jgi:hypothetical protein